MIASPLHLLDCSLISDAGSAVIMASDRFAAGRAGNVRVAGCGQGHSYYHFAELDSFSSTAAAASARAAFVQAEVSPEDIDVAEIYDSFTITTIVNLEDIGFCKKGEGGRFVQEVGIGPNGKFPCNTHGGLLSASHPGVPGGLLHVVEAVRQLRGDALGYQVKDPKLALVHNTSGELSNHATTILART
jgi:acetyl-CoA acetyltransferase